MKKILLFVASALMMLCSCQKEVVQSSISIDPADCPVGAAGGSANVTVTSTSDWVLSGDYEWVTVSKTSGANGDVVSFSIAENDTEGPRNAEYTFSIGDKTAVFKISQSAPALPEFSLVSESSVRMICAESICEMVIATDLTAKDIKCEVESGASWLKYYSINVENGQAKIQLKAAENTEYEVRSANVTFSADRCEPITVAVSQNAKSKIVLSQSSFEVLWDVTPVEIEVTEANVEYEVVIPDAYKSWISLKSSDGNKHTFEIAATEESREGVIEFTAKDGTLTVSASVMQIADVSADVEVTEVNGVDPSWVLYKEMWTAEFDVEGGYKNNDYSSWWDWYDEPMYFFYNEGTEKVVRGDAGHCNVIIDMLKETEIAGLRIRYHADRSDTQCKLYVSNDKEEWIELGTFGDGATGAANRYFSFEGCACRYFKYEGVSGASNIGIQLYNMMFYHL